MVMYCAMSRAPCSVPAAENRERQVVDARKLIAHAQAAARQTQNVVELPARIVHGERQQFDQPVVFIPADP
jgi:hypothetical protein